MNKVLDELRFFYSAVREIWNLYQAIGPGKVDPGLYAAVAVSAEHLSVLLAERGNTQAEARDLIADSERQQLRAAVDTASRLAKRCACDAAGLCFVTGEAGLIPHRDLEDQFASALQIISHACETFS